MNDQILDFQESCLETSDENCYKCSFFVGCERKYSIRKTRQEFYIQLPEAIFLFPSEEVFLEFCNDFQYEGELLKGDFEKILDLCEKFEISIITYN